MKTLLIAGGILAIFGIYGCSTYNGLVQQDEQVKAQWANVETVYQRRSDLIPNLVETVKGFMTHEKEVLASVSEARAKMGSVQLDASKLSDPKAVEQFEQAQGQLRGALSRLLVVSERYPELKANQNFLALQSQIEGSENRIAVERRKYNEIVADFNGAVRAFPKSIFAGMAGLSAKVAFKATTPGADNAPTVKF